MSARIGAKGRFWMAWAHEFYERGRAHGFAVRTKRMGDAHEVRGVNDRTMASLPDDPEFIELCRLAWSAGNHDARTARRRRPDYEIAAERYGEKFPPVPRVKSTNN